MMGVLGAAAACAAVLVLAGAARADEVVLPSVKDNTLYESAAGSISNGAGEFFFVGRSGIRGGPPTIRRGLVEFDVAGAVPAGSTIRGAVLRLHLSKSIAFTQTCSVHRVLKEWGEGASDAPLEEGQGADAVPPDATWIHAMLGESTWSSPGGDFVPAASAEVIVDGVEFYEWSGPALVADVQAWLDDPETNHGWMVRGNEVLLSSATRWDARESLEAENRPVLMIAFDAPSGCPIDYSGDGQVDAEDYLEFLGRYGAADASADLTGDGLVDFSDYLRFLDLFDTGCA